MALLCYLNQQHRHCFPREKSPHEMRPFKNLVCKTFPPPKNCASTVQFNYTESRTFHSFFSSTIIYILRNWQINSCQQSNAVSLYTLHIILSRLVQYRLVTCQETGDNNSGIIQNRGTSRTHTLPNRVCGQPNNYKLGSNKVELGTEVYSTSKTCTHQKVIINRA